MTRSFHLAGQLALVCLLMFSSAAQAARLEQLFEAQVGVSGRGTPARDRGIEQALSIVLLRVIGGQDQLDTPQARRLIKQPSRYVEQFRFSSQAARSRDGKPALALWVQFDRISLEKDVRLAGLSWWGPDRPDMLLWLAVDDNGARSIISETGGGKISRFFHDVAKDRGIPLIFPQMDLQDRRAVQFTDISGAFASNLQAASRRYHPQSLLIGSIRRAGFNDGWRTSWTFIDGVTRQHWSQSVPSLEEAAMLGVSEAAELLAIKYAYQGSSETTRPIIVEGIQGIKDYAQVLEYLDSLTPVASVDVAAVQGTRVSFNLHLNSEERHLLRVITLGKLLQPLDDAADWRFNFQP